MSKIEGPIRVIIVDDQAIIRSGLSAFLLAYSELQLVGEARDGEEALQLCELVKPDVVLMDLKMPNMDGLMATQTIHQRFPEIRLLILTNFKDHELMQQALAVGASGYLSKDITAQELAKAILEACRASPESQETTGVTVKLPEEEKFIPSEGLKTSHPSQATQELMHAGKIQTDILPDKPPKIRGYKICARLEPARETSGDFYDFLPLANGNWGFVIADVSDKGMGAALFMALTSTLIRTYTTQFPTLPALAFSEVNRRILSDTRGSMFVTAFYGVLEPNTGRFRYVNAGHNPPLLISAQKSKRIDRLGKTGMALGVMEDATWQQKIVRFAPGDMLMMYTDGITEAQNRLGGFYGEGRLIDVARAKVGCSAEELQTALLDSVHGFINETSHQDDITLMILAREK